jgi:hypothetical protein
MFKVMKTLIKENVGCLGIFFLMTILLSNFGCATPNPLAGWTYKPFPGWENPPSAHNTNHLDSAVVDDYRKFISDQHLDLLSAITGFYEDGKGQTAIGFQAFPPNKNATWSYVLIYDKKNTRIKVIKFGYHKFES